MISDEVVATESYKYFKKQDEIGEIIELETSKAPPEKRRTLDQELPSEKVARITKELFEIERELILLEREEMPTKFEE